MKRPLRPSSKSTEGIHIKFLLDLLKYVLKNNVFEFGEHHFTQLHAIAMDTKIAPALATIFIGDLEENFFKERTLKPDICVRYQKVR